MGCILSYMLQCRRSNRGGKAFTILTFRGLLQVAALVPRYVVFPN